MDKSYLLSRSVCCKLAGSRRECDPVLDSVMHHPLSHPALPSPHSQTHGNFAARAILHPGAAQRPQSILREVPEDGPTTQAHAWDWTSHLYLRSPCLLDSKQRDNKRHGTDHGLASRPGATASNTAELHRPGADAQHLKVSTSECAPCSTHSPHPI